MRRCLAIVIFLLASSGAAYAQCVGAGGIPFNCAAAGAIGAGDIVMGGQAGNTVKFTAPQMSSYVIGNLLAGNNAFAGINKFGGNPSWLASLYGGPLNYFNTLSNTEATGNVGGYSIASAFVSRSSDNLTYSSSISAFHYNDSNAGGGTAYFAMAVAPGITGGGITVEIENANGGTTSEQSPYSLGSTGVTGDLWIGVGGEVVNPGTLVPFPTAVALGIVTQCSACTGARFDKGIIIAQNAMSYIHGIGSTHAVVMEMAVNQDIRWLYGGLDSVSAYITSTNTGANQLGLVFDNNGANFEDLSGNPVAKFSATGAITAGSALVAAGTNVATFTGATTGNNPAATISGADTNIGYNMVLKGTGRLNVTGGLTVSGSIVGDAAITAGGFLTNSLTIGGGSTGTPVSILAAGGDTNISIAMTPQGTGNIQLGGPVVVSGILTAGGYSDQLSIAGASGGAPVLVSAIGSDTNVSLEFAAKGTGIISFQGPTAALSTFISIGVISSLAGFAESGGGFSTNGAGAVTAVSLGLSGALTSTSATVNGSVFINRTSAAPFISPPSNTLLHLSSNLGGRPYVVLDNSGAGGSVSPYIEGRTARGGFFTPSASQVDDSLFEIGGDGYGATGFPSTPKHALSIRAAENWSDTAQGTYIALYTTAATTTTSSEVARFNSTGSLLIAQTTDNVTDKVQVTGSIEASTHYAVGATTGLTCSGTPTASFAATGGIVTHC